MDVPSKKKKRVMPHTYAIIFFIILLMAVFTYIIPAGQFDREMVDGREIVVQNSYKQIEQQPVSFFEIFTALPEGMERGAQIIFYIFLVGGAFGVIRQTNAIDAGIYRLVQAMGKQERFLIPVVMFVFSILGFTTGMSEESIIFVPIGIAIARALGYDAIVGTAMVALGAASGFAGGMINPFTVGVAQGIAEIPIFSGIVFRSVVYMVVLGVGMVYVMRYAKKVKEDKTVSIVYQLEQSSEAMEMEGTAGDIPFTFRHMLVLLALMIGVLINMYGVFQWDWFLTELAASFTLIGLLAGIFGGLGINRTFTSFVDGMRDIVFGALIVGFARTILVVMEDGAIMDTMIHYLANAISHLPATLNVIGMYVFQIIMNFFIPSGSGQAAITMPIMAPLSDLLGMNRQVAVLAYQYGDSIGNSIIPTSASLMGVLAVAKIPYEKWVKFVWKLIVYWWSIAAIALVVAVIIGVD